MMITFIYLPLKIIRTLALNIEMFDKLRNPEGPEFTEHKDVFLASFVLSYDLGRSRFAVYPVAHQILMDIDK